MPALKRHEVTHQLTLLEALLIEGRARILLPLHAVLCTQHRTKQTMS
jgi:hypothetical protein